MRLNPKISQSCKAAAVAVYVECPRTKLAVLLPAGVKPTSRRAIILLLAQN